MSEQKLGRVRVALALTGEVLAVPGVSTPENGWTFPGHWSARDLHGKFLVFLDEKQQGFVKDETGGIKFTIAPVSAVLTRDGEIVDSNCPVALCADQYDKVVKVLLGQTVLPFQGLQHSRSLPFLDLSDIEKPSTPDPFE